MKLFTEKQLKQLLYNGRAENRMKDQYPVVKLFLPGTGFTWLLTQIFPNNPNFAFGLGDLGICFPDWFASTFVKSSH